MEIFGASLINRTIRMGIFLGVCRMLKIKIFWGGGVPGIFFLGKGGGREGGGGVKQ